MQKVKNIIASPSPLVSVLMSVYNGERYLSQAITSILNQSFGEFEFIIIDDGSKDTSWEILTQAADQDTRIRLLRNDSNLGLPKSLNRGLAQVKGAYIARMDADDVSHPERLAKELILLESTPSLVLVGSSYLIIDENGQTIKKECHSVDDTSIRWHMLFHNSFCHSAVMMRADVLASYGLSYNEECRYAQDYELWSRLMDHGSVANCEEPLISYRLHDSNQGRNFYLEQQEIATSIAIANVGKLGIQVSQKEMANLRDLFHSRLTNIRSIDLHSYYLLLLILSRFSRCKLVNRIKLAFIRLHLFREVVHLKQCKMSGIEIAKIAWEIFFIDMWSFIFAACLTALNKAGSILQERPRHVEGGY